MNDLRIPFTFSDAPFFRVAPAGYGGWQIQELETKESSIWVNVPNGWFKTSDEAIRMLPKLCEF